MMISYIHEPKLEFGNSFLCDDPKMGVAVGGFYSSTNNSHRSEIHYGVIGLKEHIDLLVKWVASLSGKIEAKSNPPKQKNNTPYNDDEPIGLFDDNEKEDGKSSNSYINKKISPDFPGFTSSSKFQCQFFNDQGNNRPIPKVKLDRIMAVEDKVKMQDEIVALYIEEFRQLCDYSNSKPDICIFVIPTCVHKAVSVVDYGKYKLNLRRKLKAKSFETRLEIPIQIMVEDTVTESRKELQDKSMIAWNFAVAQYYKCNGLPWVLNDVDPNSCFLGISFHKEMKSEYQTLRSSIAQAFNKDGRGLVFVGKQFEWDSRVNGSKEPHLTYKYSKELIKEVIHGFKSTNKQNPTRVVIHKTTSFWDKSKSVDFQEVEGFKDGIMEALGEDVLIDLVSLTSTPIKLFRSYAVKYPVLRGTLLTLDNSSAVLYATGYIPYFETYPGMHVPRPVLVKTQGDSSLNEICKEIMALTKLNFNNCNYYDSEPITIRFPKKVGELIPYFSPGVEPPKKYYFYM